jgi:RNA polymerase sigma factor (sigma-70 family)
VSFGDDVAALRPRLLRYARTLTWDRHAADDLVQDTIARAIAKQDTYVREDSLIGWLMGIEHNLFINDVRRTVRYHQVYPLYVRYDLGLHASDDTSLGRLVSEISSEIDAMPSWFRTLITLYAKGYTYAEMATMTGVEVGTVRSRLSRGHAHLRVAFERENRGSEETRYVKQRRYK